MKTCNNCNLSFPDDKMFCKKCGKPLISEYQIEPKEVAKKSVFEDRLKVDPLNVDILHEYTQFLFNNLIFKEAITVSLKMLAINENDIIAKELLLKSYFKLNMYKEASEIGKQLYSEKPTDIFLLQELAEISAKLGNLDKATEYYNQILNLQPANTAALFNKAQNLLAENQLEKAIEIFRNLHLEGQNDRITTIYASIGKVLSANYETAIKLLSPILSDKYPDTNDVNTNRGFLYLTYSLCQSSVGLTEIKKWAEKINFKNLQQNHHPLDEQTNVKISEFIVIHNLNEINSSSDAKYQISQLTKSYLVEGYFTTNSNSKIAELWYAVGSKQVELMLLEDAIVSFQKAVGLSPHESKYQQKLAGIEKTVEDAKRAKSRKTNKVIIVSLVALSIITVSIFTYQSYRESKRTVKDIEGNVYHTVTIGTQVWMVENLKTTKYNDGTSIPNVPGNAEWKNLKTPSYCWYNNDVANKNTYGALYNWHTVSTGKLAPKGWHVPTDAEWSTLINYVNKSGRIISLPKALGAKTGWKTDNSDPILVGNDVTKNNTFGFTALPCGLFIVAEGRFGRIGEGCYWWSSTEINTQCAWSRGFMYNFYDISREGDIPKDFGLSVRCVKD